MLELDDDLIDHLGNVRTFYLACFQDAVTRALERTNHEPNRVFIECSVRAGEQELGHYLDLVEVQQDGSYQPSHIVHGASGTWKDAQYALGDATLVVTELVWFAVTVTAKPIANASFLFDWFERWHKQGFAVEKPFGGYVHYMDVENTDDGIVAVVDFGTAPVEALRDLIERCVKAGAKQIGLGSSEDVLAGKGPA